ncbi:hypothetical protein NQV05_03175 [Mycoplasmopsis agalactiae]|uniref:trigger factor-related chaperone n=1 Tax=Mycoplasmopsis agalactiae TaxID=2110 RepID=UPI00211B93BD|nr:hypothetical protein [Mycoplasmopsis agalactiae]UUM25377.1 hypothetical protein NQV05_03175 [Mycoplasmopsis agalactiae]
MINYKEKKANIVLDSKSWETSKTKSIIELTSQGKKSTLSDVEVYTINKTINSKLDELFAQLRQEDPNFVAIPPIVVVDGPDKNGVKIDITITHYPSDEILKVNYSNLDIDFTYKPVPKEFLDSSFDKIIAEYPILTTADDAIVEGDVVTWSATRSLKNEIIGEDKEIRTRAEKTDQFSLNNEIIGHKVNEQFQATAPDGVTFFITILDIKRPVPTKLTDENIHLAMLPDVNSLNDFKEKIAKDTAKNNASNFLLRYYEIALDAIVSKNEISVNEQNIFHSTNNHIDAILSNVADSTHRQMLYEQVVHKTGEGLKILKRARENSIASYHLVLIDNILGGNEKISVSDEDIEREIEYMDYSMFPKPENLDKEELFSILMHQKMALYLMKINNPSQYELVKADLGFDI